MRALVVACLAVCSAVVFAALGPSPASALVGGSWTGSCPGYSVHAFTIDAECRDINGVNICEHAESVDPAANRRLRAMQTAGSCAKAVRAGRRFRAVGPARAVKNGSPGARCRRNVSTPRGRKVSASLDLSTCNQPASAGNQNGRLVCESGLAQAMSPPPPPTSRTTILHMDPPSAAGSAQTQTLPLRMPAPVIVLPAPVRLRLPVRASGAPGTSPPTPANISRSRSIRMAQPSPAARISGKPTSPSVEPRSADGSMPRG